MAFAQITPGQLNGTVVKNAASAFNSTPVNTLAGTAADLHLWVSLVATLVPLNPSPTTANLSFGTVTANASGIVNLQTNDTDLAAVSNGSATLLITGKPTSGDIVQTLATGIITVVAGA